MGPFNRIIILVKSLALSASLLCALLSSGCATLPGMGPAFRYYRSEEKAVPTILGSGKPLTPGEVRSVMDRLERKGLPADNLERRMAIEEAISGNPLVAGNRVTLLIDRPAAYAAMFRAIRNAKDNINIETFTLSADTAGYRFADLLLKKAAEGVHVNLIYDSVGSIATPPAFFEYLRGNCIEVLPFNPINPLSLLPFPGRWSLVHRDHRKLLVIDGSVAFVGSANISNVYSETAGAIIGTRGKKLPWRDTDVRIEGPAVAKFQKLFFDTWKRQHGPELPKANYFPQLKHEGKELVRVIGSTWGEQNRDTYLAYLAAIRSATVSIHLTCAYFIPDEQTLRALIGAVRRGVDVKIILPHKSDSRLALYGGRNYYSQLLKYGVRLYERRGVIMHAKTAVIDGVWSTVGSTNIDLWSFLRDNELNAVILSRDFANRMEAMFQRDLCDSDEITSKSWQRRSPGERLMELFSAPFIYWL